MTHKEQETGGMKYRVIDSTNWPDIGNNGDILSFFPLPRASHVKLIIHT
jgi:hypothetical protein